MSDGLNPALRRAAILVAALNLGYFAVEFTAALVAGSVSLVADSIDFLEDTALNSLVAVGLGWTARARARLGSLLALLILVPAFATLWVIASKVWRPVTPEPAALSLTGAGAMVVNLVCAFILARHRSTGGSLAKAAFLSARNDVAANVLIIAAGVMTASWPTIWPDLAAGLLIAALNAGAASAVWHAARAEANRVEP